MENDKDLVQIPVLISGMSTKVDGSVKLILETRELSEEYAGKLYGMRNSEAWAVIAPDKMTKVIVPDQKPDPMTGARTQGQRIRSVLFVLWKQQGSQSDFETFYKTQTERYIERIKDELEPI